MEIIVALLVLIIVGQVFLHVARLGYAMYLLKSASSDVADVLNKAREIAMKEKRRVSVIFDFDRNKYGIDRNGNGRLEDGEAEDLPEGIALSDNSVISFLPTGAPPSKSRTPNIIISNSRSSRKVSVSALGSIEIE